ncbi:hypothetical protein CJ739_743 [Mariniflexile rhizosphaerae]|uniref:hypothetical protein n=1 Tax=unclassified Mariniflexile TaxID=2643887 RepID=UPI000E32DE14|nr:hypothetical protein [Mariniflexile sp. TRM1-10]AXP79839.1 hypothetical protein CJ739_743 [Mariniflexile sp. TRM1-10]
MDTTAQIKNNLINRIKNSKDLNFLRALQTIFDTSEQALYELSTEQNKAIEAGRHEITNGTYKEHKEVMSEMKQWLTKK